MMSKPINIFNDVKFLFGANKYTDLPNNDNRVEFAFWGRSNVGKSSTINSIANNSSIARISQKPGCTRQINIFAMGDGQTTLADLPGYGYAAVSKTIASNLYQLCYDYLCKRHIAVIFLLIDARRGIMQSDAEVIDAIKDLNHNICVIFTKIDKLKTNYIDVLKNNVITLSKRWINITAINAMRSKNFHYAFISNKEKQGIDRIRERMIWYLQNH